MKKYNTIAIIDGYEEELFICELTADDVTKAEKEFSLYMQSKGKTYDLDINKYPSVRNFFKLYFGECECDIYCGECWTTPNRYICTNKNVADRFMKLAKQLDYHNRYNQTFCTVEQDGKIVNVGYGDY
jgi:hypothetical protein